MSAVGGAASGSCAGAASNTVTAGSGSKSFSGITIPGTGSGGNCTVTFSVTSSTLGTNPNATSGVTTTQTSIAGNPSNTANLTVVGPPTVSSITRLDVNPTSASSVNFFVTFSRSVTGVDVNDFSYTTSGGIVLPPPPGAISNVTPAGPSQTYTVTVNTGTGDGTIRLDVIDNDSILSNDAAALPLGGTGAG